MTGTRWSGFGTVVPAAPLDRAEDCSGMISFPGILPTAVESLPHTGPVVACALVQQYLPDIPAWPQLRGATFARTSRVFPGFGMRREYQ